MISPLRTLVALFLLACALPVSGAERRPLVPQDLWAVKRLGSPELSPDGTQVVFTLQEWSIEKNKSTANLWRVPVSGGDARRLTTASSSDSSPTWSPEGRRIAFLSKRGDDENACLYVIPVDGGEPEKILEMPYSLSNPKWLPDGSGLILATTVIPELAGDLGKTNLAAMKKEIKRRKDSKMTAKVTENRQYRYFDHYITDNLAHRLIRVDLKTRKVVDLTPGWNRLFTVSGEVFYDLAPDGRSIALSINSTAPPYADFPNSDIYLLSADTPGSMRNLTTDNRGDDGTPLFAPDGASLIYGRRETPYYSGEFTRIWRHDLKSGRNAPLTESLDFSFESYNFSSDGKTIWTTAEDKGSVAIFKMNSDGTGFMQVYRSGSTLAMDVRGGSLVFLNDTTSRPAELFSIKLPSGSVKQLTSINKELMDQIHLGKVEEYWFTGANGDNIHGWLVFPPDYDKTRRYPMVQLMHGGPHTMNRDSFSYRWNTHLFAAPGYVVTWVNRHGSTGFGEKFSRSILNQWGDMPFEDIMKSTDHLLKTYSNLDSNRLAAAGASYGGFMAAWVLGHTDRFKAIINHAGVNSSYAQYGTDVPHGFPEVMGGKPWENLEGMQRQNPMFYAKNFKTPTLILHGELDYRVPYGNGLELYGVLQALRVPSRLVVFPNENHWILTPQNAIYWHWEMQNWLSRYIGGKPVLEKPVFESDSK